MQFSSIRLRKNHRINWFKIVFLTETYSTSYLLKLITQHIIKIIKKQTATDCFYINNINNVYQRAYIIAALKFVENMHNTLKYCSSLFVKIYSTGTYEIPVKHSKNFKLNFFIFSMSTRFYFQQNHVLQLDAKFFANVF